MVALLLLLLLRRLWAETRSLRQPQARAMPRRRNRHVDCVAPNKRKQSSEGEVTATMARADTQKGICLSAIWQAAYTTPQQSTATNTAKNSTSDTAWRLMMYQYCLTAALGVRTVFWKAASWRMVCIPSTIPAIKYTAIHR